MRARTLAGLAGLGWLTLAACTAPLPVTTDSVTPILPPAPTPAATALPTATAILEVPTAEATAVPTEIPAPTPEATPPPAAPTLVPPVAPTEEPAPTATAPATTPTPSQPAAACRETQGRLSVAYLDSTVLARRVVYSIYLPPCYDQDTTRSYPTLYLLHGANTDNTQWPDLNVAPDADLLIAQRAIAPLVVVMPDGNYRPGEDYAAFLLRDLLPHIEQTSRVARTGSQRAIGGLSLGGWWALGIAGAHPDLFSAVGGHSPVTDAALGRRFAQLAPGTAPRIYLDVGRDDSLAAGVTAFGNALTAQGLSPSVHVYPGAHNRPYWRAHTAEYLRFYALTWAVP